MGKGELTLFFARLERQVTAERDAFEKERDVYLRQFDDLSKIRNTQAEENFKSYRDKAEARAESASFFLSLSLFILAR